MSSDAEQNSSKRVKDRSQEDVRATAPTDEELILQFQQGDERAFWMLEHRYRDKLLNYVARMLGDADTAEDIIQDTMIRVFEKKDRYRADIARFSTWIYRIAINMTKSEMRRVGRKRRKALFYRGRDGEEVEVLLPDRDPLPDEIAGDAMRGTRIEEALDELPDDFKETLILRYVNGLSYEEVAALLEVPLGTVKSRINRGRAILMKQLGTVYDRNL
jgi:RNA polymerase sigma factor (sigma-70 family)